MTPNSRNWSVIAGIVAAMVASFGCGNDLRVESTGPIAAADATNPRFSAETSKGSSAKASDAKGEVAATLADGATTAPTDSANRNGGAPTDGQPAPADGGPSMGYNSDNGTVYTADATVCDAAEFCATNADCPVTPCSVGLCSGGCCINKPAADGKVCDDGDPCSKADKCKAGVCAGTSATCDDGLDCTTDNCDPATAKCYHPIADKWCLIAGKCVAEGQASQATPCKTCAPAQSSDGWTVTADCCGNDTECPNGTVCDIATCDPTTNKCGLKKVVGCCSSDAECSDGNACTKDTCDLPTGTCGYIAVTCTDPNPCQAATCDGASGECKISTKAGWCLIDGACHPEGEANGSNDCLICASAKSTTKWTAATNSLCSDNNPCTFGDACTPGGKCVGTPQPGCCLSDADCGSTGDPCSVNVCDAKLGLCTPKAIANCCTTGLCCDAATNTIKAAKAPCGSSVTAEFQCSGQAIQKREISAGCNGTSNTGCVAGSQYQNISNWQTIQTCGTGTACTATGSAQMPTCKVTTPTGSCTSSCGAKSATGNCYCDSVCTGVGDCCTDFMALCGCAAGECCDVAKKFPLPAGTTCGSAKTQFQCVGQALQKRTGTTKCDGKNVCVTAASAVSWSSWATTQTCPSGQNCKVAADSSSGSCVAAPAGTCVGHCGGKSLASCWCDSACKALGDCCGDFDKVGCGSVQSCGAKPADSCKGKCGGQASSLCYCDEACDTFGDCCADKAVCSCL